MNVKILLDHSWRAEALRKKTKKTSIINESKNRIEMKFSNTKIFQIKETKSQRNRQRELN